MSYPSFTADEFRNKLREDVAALASGERQDIKIPLDFFEHCEDDAIFAKKATPQYIRMIASRVPEVVQGGRISIKRLRDDDRGLDYYEIRFIKGVKPSKMISAADLPGLEKKWRAKFIKYMLQTQPRISDLKGEQLEGAAIALERFATMLNEMVEEQ